MVTGIALFTFLAGSTLGALVTGIALGAVKFTAGLRLGQSIADRLGQLGRIQLAADVLVLCQVACVVLKLADLGGDGHIPHILLQIPEPLIQII